MNKSISIDRLGIPSYNWWSEACHGVRQGGYTVYPQPIGMAAAFNAQLFYDVFSQVSDEARANWNRTDHNDPKLFNVPMGVVYYPGNPELTFWCPNVNIFRDPRWGRGQETCGEDPYLNAVLGVQTVLGMQGNNDKYFKTHACAKHYAVHSGPEPLRHSMNVEPTNRDLWETYLPAFKALVQKGNVAEVMCAYQRIDGDPCCGNARYERHILRDEWGFKGLITSDCGAIRDFLPRWHNVSKDGQAAAAKAVLSGTDLECGSEYRDLPAAVKRGDISEEQINISLKRLLTARFELGDFDKDELVEWTKIPSSVIASKEHKQLALQIAREGVVLLKNNGSLPLSSSKGKGHIVVMGPNANDSIMQWGNYSGFATKTVTVLEGLRKELGNVPYIQGCALTRNEVFESRFDKIRAPEGGKGIRAYYWNNTEMKGDPVTTVVITNPINLSNGGNTVFAPGVNLENFSARYMGTLIPTEDETLTFKVGADDMVRVMVNGDTLVNIWRARQRIQEAQPTLNVKKGVSYRIQIDYVQGGGMAAMQFDVCKKQNPTRQQILAQIGDAETIVFVGGISPRVEGEEMKVSDPGFKGGDRTDIELPQVQRDLLKMLHEAGKKVVFVNCSGGAMAMVPELETCDAIIQGWYGGERGGQAIAEVITGKVNPSGKLPMTFYRSVNDLPDFLDYTMKNRTYRYFQGEALFPFGYGLSYTAFDISKPAYIKNKVQFTVKNTGTMDGTEVVQVYVRRLDDKEGPLKTLRAYQRVTLKAGGAQMVAIDFPRERFEGWDTKTNTMRVVPGKYEIMVGSSSADKDLKRITVNVK